MELRQLRYFLSISEHGSLSAAAQHLHVAQPALSQYVKKLEEDLGIQLLVRSPRGVTLTENGKILLKHAHTIIDATDAAISDLRERTAEPQGQVCVGLPSSVGMVLSVPLAETIRHNFPRISLRVMDAMSGHIQEWLLAGSIDLGALYDIEAVRLLNVSPVLVEELFLIASPDAWNGPVGPDGVALSPITLSACAKLDLILPSRTHGLRAMIERFANEHSVFLEPVLEMDALPQIKELIVRGSGFTILAESAMRREVENRTLVLVPIIEPEMRRTVHFVRNPERVLTRAVIEVERVMNDIARELVRKGRWRGHFVEALPKA